MPKPPRKIGVGGALIIALALVFVAWFWLPALIRFALALLHQP
jgi:hypothetical protein